MRRIRIVLPILLASACGPSALPLREDSTSAASIQAAEAPAATVPALTPAPSGWVVPAAPPAPPPVHEHGAAPAPAESRPAKAALYTCPMHPEVRSREPGKCPACGMTLERVEETP